MDWNRHIDQWTGIGPDISIYRHTAYTCIYMHMQTTNLQERNHEYTMARRTVTSTNDIGKTGQSHENE